MKKICAFILAGIMSLSLTACSEKTENNSVYAPPLISTTGESTAAPEITSSEASTDSEPRDQSNISNASETSVTSSETVSSVIESRPEQSSSVIQSSSSEQSSSAAQSSNKPQSSSSTKSSSSSNSLSSLSSSSVIQSSSSAQSSSSIQSSSAPVSSSSAQSSSAAQSSSKPQSSSVRSSSVPQSTLPPQPSVPEVKTPKVLVTYFSATHTTEKIAKLISEALNADVYEIIPAIPYTSADLDYGNSHSRSSIEMNDPNSRPEISGSVKNLAAYDIVFIGYPIWWGEAPRILDTFVEANDFSGKTVVPFCTSASSGVGSSSKNLERLANGGKWLPGTRYGSNTSSSEIKKWINGLGLDVKA